MPQSISCTHAFVCTHTCIYTCSFQALSASLTFPLALPLRLHPLPLASFPHRSLRRWVDLLMHVRCVMESRIYALGGYDGSSWLNTVECLDSRTSEWRPEAPMPSRRSGLTCCVFAGRVYALGGYDGKNFLNAVESLDVATGEWRIETPMPTKRCPSVSLCPTSLSPLPHTPFSHSPRGSKRKRPACVGLTDNFSGSHGAPRKVIVITSRLLSGGFALVRDCLLQESRCLFGAS